MRDFFTYESLSDDETWECFSRRWDNPRDVALSQYVDTTVGLGYECRVVRVTEKEDGTKEITVLDDPSLSIPKPRREETMKQFMQNYRDSLVSK